MSGPVGITAYGVYLPRLRLDRSAIAGAWGTAQAAGQIAVANYDEDALTLAAEAAAACLTGDATPDGLYFASVSSPYAEKQVAGLIATAHDLSRHAQTVDFTGSVRAGVSALIAAVDAVRSGRRADIVVAAADTRLAAPESELEGLLGDAGAAVRVGATGVIAEVVDVACVSEEFTHLWRTDTQRYVQGFPGKFSNTYGYARDLGEAIRIVLARQGLEPAGVARLAVYAPDGRAAIDLARQLGFDPKRQLVPPPVTMVGCVGTADALASLAAALDTVGPDEFVLVGAPGEGADVVLLRTTAALPAARAAQPWQEAAARALALPSYEKYLKYRRTFEADEPGEAINNVLERKELKQDIRLYGSRCSACDTVQFPIARVCIRCQARDGLVDHKLGRRGSIFTFTIDHLIANLEHPLPMAVVDLDGGGRLYLQVTDFADGEVAIGRPVTLTFRRLHDGGGNHNYFWKARPTR